MTKKEDGTYNRDHWFEAHLNQCEYEIVEDMIQIEAGGFAPGARLSTTELVHLLADKALAKGTTLKKVSTGQIFHVDYRKGLK
jgi:hypothetical protein